MEPVEAGQTSSKYATSHLLPLPLLLLCLELSSSFASSACPTPVLPAAVGQMCHGAWCNDRLSNGLISCLQSLLLQSASTQKCQPAVQAILSPSQHQTFDASLLSQPSFLQVNIRFLMLSCPCCPCTNCLVFNVLC